MNYNFDIIVDRRNTNSVKWDNLNSVFGRSDILPMWVADMDFKSPEPVIEAIRKRAEHGVYGYAIEPDTLYDAVKGWVAKRHGWAIENQWQVFIPGVVTAINIAVNAFTKPGDGVIIQTPVYPPFHNAVNNNGRRLITSALKSENGHYSMDFDDLEEKIDEGVKLIILCSPHNPVGRVWSREELIRLGEICITKNVTIVSDEIHSDLVYGGNKHVPIASISEKLLENTITCIAPSKTFNVAGLSSSVAIIPHEGLRRKFNDEKTKMGIGSGNIFGLTAMEASYLYGEEWLNELLGYLDGNAAYLADYINSNIPRITVSKPEGTYLAWLDCRKMNMTPEALGKFMTEKAKVGLNNGINFGIDGSGFMRMNFGCPRSLLEEGLERIEKAVKALPAASRG